jgi:hypothetical protein
MPNLHQNKILKFVGYCGQNYLTFNITMCIINILALLF